MASKKTTIANALLEYLLRNGTLNQTTTVYAALFSVVPTAGAPGTELVGDGYSRKAITFDAAAGGITQNDIQVTFDAATADWLEIVGMAICDAATLGDQIYFTGTAPKTISASDVAAIAIGAVTVAET